MSEDINVTDGTVLECLNNKVDLDGRNYLGSGLEEIIKKTGGSGLEIGDIAIAPFGIDESQNKRRYLNGQVISQSQFESFTKKIKEAIAVNSNLAATEENWQAEVTNSVNGTCGKFVIDDNAGTIRLPKYPEYVSKEYVESAVVGNGMALGLTNGSSNSALQIDSNQTYLGARQGGYGNNVGRDVGSGNAGLGASKSLGVTKDPTKSGVVADLKNATTEKIPCKWFIQVATGVEESVDVTREIELNNPFSLLDYKWSEYELSNASWLLSNGAFHSGTVYKSVYELLLKIHNGTETKDGVSVKLSTEAYEDTDFVINTADTTFRLPIKVKLASGNAVVGNGMTLGLTKGDTNYGLTTWVTQNERATTARTTSYGVALPGSTKGSEGVYPADGDNLGITTDPTKSGIETSSSGLKLYFYVGETIQDANVIAASNALTTLADCVKKSSATDRETVVGWGMPDYTTAVTISGSTFTATYKGWLIGTTATPGTTESYSKINDLNIGYEYNDYVDIFAPMDIGDVFKTNASSINLKFLAMKGNQ